LSLSESGRIFETTAAAAAWNTLPDLFKDKTIPCQYLHNTLMLPCEYLDNTLSDFVSALSIPQTGYFESCFSVLIFQADI